MRKRHSTRVGLAALSGLAGGLVATATVLLATPSQTTNKVVVAGAGARSAAPIAQTQGALTAQQVYRLASPGVVSIRAVSSAPSGMPGFFGSAQARQADEGAGIVLSKDGLIVTNNHVVAGAASITVSLGGASGAIRPAQVVARDASDDLALIKISASGLSLHPLSLADSSTVQVGDATYAIGNPFGLDQTLTSGVVSALQRKISAPNGATIAHVIQTDAALNPGNSGGPLLDTAGRVIGINSQIASTRTAAGGQGTNTGIGFAVPSNTVRSFVGHYAPALAHAGPLGS